MPRPPARLKYPLTNSKEKADFYVLGLLSSLTTLLYFFTPQALGLRKYGPLALVLVATSVIAIAPNARFLSRAVGATHSAVAGVTSAGMCRVVAPLSWRRRGVRVAGQVGSQPAIQPPQFWTLASGRRCRRRRGRPRWCPP